MFSHISTLLLVQRKTDLSAIQRDALTRELAENLPHFVWASDERGRKTYCSHRYLDFTGAADIDEMDRSWKDFLHPDDRTATAQTWMHSIESGEPYAAEYRLRRMDGAFRYVKAQALPICDTEGRVTGWLGMSKDITVQRVVEQTRETEAKLAAVKCLASSIAHEINNPLESVTNAVFLASQNKSVDETAQGYLTMADAELRRLAQVTASSLRFHKQAGRPLRTRLGLIIDRVLAQYKTRLEAAAIRVNRKYQDEAELLCYAEDLTQAICHVIRNSIDAMTTGGTLSVRLRIIRGRSSEQTSQIRITVADTGHGFAPSVAACIFEPFFTTNGATHAGLGLWVTDQIIRKHKGAISVRSSVDQFHHGTTFSLTLPADSIDRVR